MAKNILTHNLSEPLNGAKKLKVNIDPGDGNLTIEALSGSEPVLVSGTLEYLDSQGIPTSSVNTSSDQANIILRKGSNNKGQTWLRFPWAACNGATTWRVHLNPSIAADITAHSAGGNVRLDLTGMVVTLVAADTGGGNVEVKLPDHANNLNVTAKTGGGAVTVEMGSMTGINRIEAGSGAGSVALSLPGGIPARIYATSGMGKVIVDPCFPQVDKTTYQSPEYDRAADRVEITLKSGAGNVTITTRAA